MASSLWRGKRVTLMGLGRHGGGVGAARWLAAQGAQVTITDLSTAEALRSSLQALAGVPIVRFRLGGHEEADFASADVVVVNPAVKPGHPLVQRAMECGAQITSEVELFLNVCPAPVIAVTGSNGKSTTAAMTAAILQAAGRRTWLGGNIGGSLLDDWHRMSAEDAVVLELSSFQLHYLADDVRGPEVAIVTNCTANHLDWHATYEQYARAKQRLLRLQPAESATILNPFAPELQSWRPLVRGRLVDVDEQWHIPPLRTPGRHNQCNARLAAAAAQCLGCDTDAADRALRSFVGLPHRLQWLADVQGRRFYNDSKATTPEAVIAAVRAIEGPLWLLAGGVAKGGDYAAMVQAVGQHARGAAFLGTAGRQLFELARQHAPESEVYCTETLSEALECVWRRSRAGEAIVLSPGCASFDQFTDYADRGRRFAEMVNRLA